MGDSSTAYNALSGTQAVTCEAGPGTYDKVQSTHGFALAADLKQGDVIYLSCHIALKSVTGLMRIGFEPVIDGQPCRCWFWISDATTEEDFDGIYTRSYTVSADVPAGTNLIQTFAYIQPFSGKAFTVADGGYARIDHLMMSIGQPAAWAPAEGEALTADGGGGGMTEPTNLVKVQPDESHLYSATVQRLETIFAMPIDDLPVSSATAVHFAITVRAESGKTINPGTLNLWMQYKKPSGEYGYSDTYYTASTIGDSWTRIETTGTIPAGMTAKRIGITLYKTASLYMTNLTVYLLTGGPNLAKTQPDETHLYSATVGHVGVWASGTSGFVPMSLSANTDVHAAITVMSKSGALDAGTIYLSINYTDSAGYSNWMTTHNAIGVGVSWTRIEMTVTIPAGMTIAQVAVGLSKTASLYMTNLTVYPLTGGRIVRARGATAGYISKAKEATVLYTPSKSARQVRVILLDETGSSIYDIQSVAIVADAEELQGKVAAQESSIQTIQSDMTTVQSGLSGLNVRLASMQTELAGVSAGDVLYQVPYTVTDGKATFTAAVYKSGVECHTSYDPSCFTWYLKTEAGTVKIGTGYSVTVNVGDVGYGGFVVGVFETQ